MPIRSFSALPALTTAVCLAGIGLPAHAADLTVQSIEVLHAVQYGTSLLIGDNVTWVRVKVGVAGTGGAPVLGVDAALRMTIDGVPQPLPPIFSLNGPITAQIVPNSALPNDTINFAVVPPISNNVVFTVEVNPNRSVKEDNYLNNTLSISKAFLCRKTLEVTYVPITYFGTPAPETLMEPGIGDGFLRAIYKPGEWNYHKSPLLPLLWNTDINGSSTALLNALNDIRNIQLPANGQPIPDFIYGWLPGNPYSGNGQAGGIPSNRAFGNTDPSRFQRTMAHELGHCFGLSHNSTITNIVGADVEWHLFNTQGLPQIFPTNKNDIMVAGLLTNQAWVASNTYTVMLNDSRVQCPPTDADPDVRVPVMRVSGVIDNATRNIALDPVTRFALAEATANEPGGDTTVIAYDAQGNELTRVTVRTDTNRELCVVHAPGKPVLDPQSGLYVMLPETINGQAIARIEVVDEATKRVTGAFGRSARSPQGQFAGAMIVPEAADAPAMAIKAGGEVRGKIRLSWEVSDADGDALLHTLLYSPDGGESWDPLVVNTPDSQFEFASTDIAGSSGATGRFRLVSTDGFNVIESDSPAFVVGPGAVPQTYLITPNDNSSFPQKAPIAFHASSWDVEDKMLNGAQLQWTSSLDGVIGSGQLFVHSNLSPGTHLITVTGTDTSAQFSSKAITVFVTPRVVIHPDCNNNGILDIVDIANGTSTDGNGNNVPDECETPSCDEDVTGDNVVNIDDLLAVISAWGQLGNLAADVNGDFVVDINDLLDVIAAWGPCQ